MKSLIGAALLLTLASSSEADCGFVLWDSAVLETESGRRQSMGMRPVATHETLADCEADKRRYYALGRGDRTWSGRDTMISAFLCFPGGIDPRERTGR